MNRKKITFIIAISICATLFGGCSGRSNHSNISSNNSTAKEEGKATEDFTSESEVTSDESILETTTISTTTSVSYEMTTSVTTAPPIQESLIETDDSAIVSVNEDGSFNVIFQDGICTMTFPASWAGRVVIYENEIYSKLCWDSNSDWHYGKFLSLMTANDDTMNTCIPDSYLLGTANDQYVIAFKPTYATYDPTNQVLYEEYRSLCNDISSVIASTECISSPEFTPIDMNDYDSPNMYSVSAAGSWEASSYMNSEMQFTPYIGFRPKDGVFGYMYQLNGVDADKEIGRYLTNVNAENYQWNTENWGEAGLIFMGGCIYRFTYYLSMPKTMNLEKLAGNSEYDSISSETWLYVSDFQDFDANYNDN